MYIVINHAQQSHQVSYVLIYCIVMVQYCIVKAQCCIVMVLHCIVMVLYCICTHCIIWNAVIAAQAVILAAPDLAMLVPTLLLVPGLLIALAHGCFSTPPLAGMLQGKLYKSLSLILISYLHCFHKHAITKIIPLYVVHSFIPSFKLVSRNKFVWYLYLCVGIHEVILKP